MLTFTCQKHRAELPESARLFLKEDMLLFDIETTGLSSSSNRIYLTGLGWLDGDLLTVRQYLTECAADEAVVIGEANRIAGMSRFKTLVTFNGSTFDLPFFTKRCRLHAAAECIPSDAGTAFYGLSHLDLYRALRPVRALFPLTQYRQKDFEALLGIGREDQYDGGKLISVYHRFEKTKKQADRDLLCLHNKEDLFGMFHLLSLLSCLQIRENSYAAENFRATSANELSVRFRIDRPVPVSIRCLRPNGSLLIRETSGLAVLPLHRGALRCALPNPKDYYYLTEENTVVHKSVGQFVDPAYRRKAAPEECYIEHPVPPEYLNGETYVWQDDPLFANIQAALDSFFKSI